MNTPSDIDSTNKVAKIQLTPNDWITAAFNLLTDSSIDSVRVDILAKELGVTRGSFYWHFKDRSDLLARMLNTWRDAATESIIQRFDKSGATPEALIKELLTLPFRGRAAINSSSIELSIRAWARRDDMARKVVDAVDAQRLTYIARCFTELGCQTSDAHLRAFMVYSYMITESLLQAQYSEQERIERRDYIQKTVLHITSAPA